MMNQLSRSAILKPHQYKSLSSNIFVRQVGLVIGAYDSPAGDECTELSTVGQKMDEALQGKLREALNGVPAGIGKLGRVIVLDQVSPEFPQIAVAGLGSKDAGFDQVEYLHRGKENVRIAAGAGARALQKMGVQEIKVEGFNEAEAAAEGANLGVWYFTDKEVETKVSLHEEGDPEAWERGVTKASAQNLVRCLCETPPNYLTPRMFAVKARDILCPYGVQVFARDTRWMKINDFNALLSLAASSVEPPLLLEINYCGDNEVAEKPYLLVGQGAMFNSGGLCRINCTDMMKAEVASAAIILGIFKAVAGMRLPLNIRAFIPLYENMLGGSAMKPGDVLKIRNKSVITENTRNHSQITMAEALVHGIRVFPPELVFGFGTLSPNLQQMLGAVSAVWSRNDYIWDHINYAGAMTGDRMWRYPLFDAYDRKLKARTDVDVTNLGRGTEGEPNLVAAFLNNFVNPQIDFTYIDVTGSSDTANGYVHYLAENLMTGAPTRGMLQLLCHLNYCKEQMRAASKGDRSEAEN